ncbi:MAG: hypothetical protein FWF63_08230 [Fibromonadales bacterium]|nr:hypothetical protein [Fibromonadales bacterium]
MRFDGIGCGVDYINIAQFEQKFPQKKAEEKLGDVRTKMKLGRKLSYDEKVFIKINAQDLYERAMKLEEERDEFRRALANCKTKEEAKRLQVTKSMELQTETQNKGDLEFITTRMMRMMGILDEFSSFAKSKEYVELPSE